MPTVAMCAPHEFRVGSPINPGLSPGAWCRGICGCDGLRAGERGVSGRCPGFICVRPSGPKEGVLVAWGFTEAGERVLLAVMLGMRESHEDWQAHGRDLIARGLGAPMLIVADGAPGLNKAIEQCWPASDRQRCC